jgi:hypothetical protein
MTSENLAASSIDVTGRVVCGNHLPSGSSFTPLDSSQTTKQIFNKKEPEPRKVFLTWVSDKVVYQISTESDKLEIFRENERPEHDVKAGGGGVGETKTARVLRYHRDITKRF